MSSVRLTVPPPSDDDHEDVAWALRAASAQWRRDAHTDAVAWVERAAETAEEVGHIQRSIELLQLAAALKRGAQSLAPPMFAPSAAPPLPPLPGRPSGAMAPPLPPGVGPSIPMAPPPPAGAVAPPLPLGARPPMPSIEVEVEEVDFDEVDELDDIEELDEAPAPFPAVATEGSSAVEGAAFPAEAAPDAYDADAYAQGAYAQGEAAHDAPDAHALGAGAPDDTRTFLQDLPRFAADFAAAAEPPVPAIPKAPAPAGISLGVLRGLVADSAPESAPDSGAPSLDFTESESGEMDPFGDGFDEAEEHPTDRPAAGPFDSTTEVTSPEPVEGGFDEPATDPNHEFGEIDFSEEAPTSRRSVELLAVADPRITPPTYQASTGGLDLDLSSPAEVAMSRRAEQLGHHEDLEKELGVDLSVDVNRAPLAPRPAPAPAPPADPRPVGMASVRPSRPPGATDRIASQGPEPFAHAPSASLPPVEPPSRPSQAPPAVVMREPAPWMGTPSPARLEPNEPIGALPSAPPLPRIEQPRGESERPASMRVRGTVVDGIDLLNVPGLQDLPEEAQLALLQSAQMMRLERGVEAASFGVALVTHGAVQIMPAIADAACGIARKGEVIFTQGSLPTGVELRVVGFDPGSRVALFSRQVYEAAVADCPWVADELALVADKYQALAGAVMGPLGDSLDDMFRSMVLDKCTVKRPGPGDSVAKRGKALDGLYIVGAGSVDVLAADGSVKETLGPGDFLFPQTLLGGSPAP
ncbi:MAG TPA: hypothetical protein VLC09_20235, partial [Polyangiaceae bacterium]|nr:hypothetical protein [Polyangiaceae bacterium]